MFIYHWSHENVKCENLYVFFHSCSKIGTPEEKANATAKALDMSLQYNFVTPLTSMVVIKPETEDGTDSPLIADKLTGQRGFNKWHWVHFS